VACLAKSFATSAVVIIPDIVIICHPACQGAKAFPPGSLLRTTAAYFFEAFAAAHVRGATFALTAQML